MQNAETVLGIISFKAVQNSEKRLLDGKGKIQGRN